MVYMISEQAAVHMVSGCERYFRRESNWEINAQGSIDTHLADTVLQLAVPHVPHAQRFAMMEMDLCWATFFAIGRPLDSRHRRLSAMAYSVIFCSL